MDLILHQGYFYIHKFPSTYIHVYSYLWGLFPRTRGRLGKHSWNYQMDIDEICNVLSLDIYKQTPSKIFVLDLVPLREPRILLNTILGCILNTLVDRLIYFDFYKITMLRSFGQYFQVIWVYFDNFSRFPANLRGNGFILKLYLTWRRWLNISGTRRLIIFIPFFKPFLAM